MLNKIRQKKTNCMMSLLHGIRKYKQKQELIDKENRLMFSRGRGEGWAKWVKGVQGVDQALAPSKGSPSQLGKDSKRFAWRKHSWN